MKFTMPSNADLTASLAALNLLVIAFFIASTLSDTNVATFSHVRDVLFFTLSHTPTTLVLIALNTVLAVDLREFQRPERVFLIAFQVVDVDVLIIFQTLAIFSFKLLNVRVADKHGWEEKESIKNIIKKYQEELGDNGQILVRASGTEPLIRIMAEGPQQERLEEIASAIAEVVNSELG